MPIVLYMRVYGDTVLLNEIVHSFATDNTNPHRGNVTLKKVRNVYINDCTIQHKHDDKQRNDKNNITAMCHTNERGIPKPLMPTRDTWV